MDGLRLAESFFKENAERFSEDLPSGAKDAAAFGLSGEGSECFGFDDLISEDHDFGPDFCIWLTDDVFDRYGNDFKRAYEMLPQEFMGYRRGGSELLRHRRGVWRISDFYRYFTGLDHVPANNREWLRLPQSFLAACTNGKVFSDVPGEFTGWRNALLDYYPDDVVLKKLAAKAVLIGQSGQYNYPRLIKRGDLCAASLAASRFTESVLAAIFLLMKKYMPYYKWSFKAAESETAKIADPALSLILLDLKTFVLSPKDKENEKKNQDLIESVCCGLTKEFRRRGLSDCRDDFAEAHSRSLMAHISDPWLRSLDPLIDFEK